jgi:hypothetical protein
MIELFHYDDKEDQLVFDSPIAREYKVFKELWRRKVKMAGDFRGDLKLLNGKEFMYIWFMADWTRKNPFYAMDEKAKHKHAVEACDMPEGWEPDALVMEGIKTYKEVTIKFTPSASAVVNLERTIQQSADVIDLFREQNEALLHELKKQKALMGDGVSPDDIEFFAKSGMIIKNNIIEILSLNKAIKSARKDAKEMYEDLAEELAEQQKIRGGRTLGNRENPR